MAVALEQFEYVAPIESLSGFRTLRRAIWWRGISPQHVLVICVRDDLTSLLLREAGEVRVVGRGEIPGLVRAFLQANQEVAQVEALLTHVDATNDFLWAILWQFQGEYLLHVQTCWAFVAQVVRVCPRVTWLVVADGWQWGNGADQFGLHSPVLFIVLRTYLAEAGGRLKVVGFTLRRFMPILLAVMIARLVVSMIVFGIISVINQGLGLGSRISTRARFVRQADILVFFQELFSISSLPTMVAVLASKGHSLYRVEWANLFFVRRARLVSDLYALGQHFWRIIAAQEGVTRIGRIDNRTHLSRWFFIALSRGGDVKWREYWELIQQAGHQAQLAWQQVSKIKLLKAGGGYPLGLYTRLVILNYLPEYLFSASTLTAILRQVKPRLVVYPDGYAMLVRLAQRWGSKYHYQTVQVPHGYPNRTFPRSYYWADHYLASSILTERQLVERGCKQSAIRWVTHEGGKAWQTEASPLHPLPQKEAVGLLYSGSLAYWSYPNQYQELWEVSCQLIEEIRRRLPQVRIIVKSHPNGTSPYFFRSLATRFAQDFRDKKIIHVPGAWKSAAEFRQLSVAMAPVIFPSTPTMQLLALGIPLLFVAGSTESPLPNIFYPHHRHMVDYPFFFSNATPATAFLERLIREKPLYDEARQSMLAYSDRLLMLEGGHGRRSLPDILSDLL